MQLAINSTANTPAAPEVTSPAVAATTEVSASRDQVRGGLRRSEVDALHAAIRDVNKSEELGNGQELRIRVDSDTKRLVVQVVSRDNNEVLMQVPSEVVLQLAKHLRMIQAEPNVYA